jgi:hypothetical protein
VQHAAVVRRGEACTELPSDVERFFRGQRSDAAKERGERFPVDIFHREVMPAFGFADVVHAADVRMCDVAREADFRDEAVDEAGVHGAARRQQFQRDTLAELEVVSPVHLAGRPAPEQADDAIAQSEDAARRKTRVLERLDVGNARTASGIEPCDGRFVADAGVGVIDIRERILRDSARADGDRNYLLTSFAYLAAIFRLEK